MYLKLHFLEKWVILTYQLNFNLTKSDEKIISTYSDVDDVNGHILSHKGSKSNPASNVRTYTYR